MTILALPSCKSVDPSLYTIHRDSVAYTIHQSIDTVLVHDSIYIREIQKGDTIYLTRTEYRDRWRIREVHDTIHNTQYITQTIEHPPERYVPKFYKWSTALFYIFLVLFIFYIIIKLKV